VAVLSICINFLAGAAPNKQNAGELLIAAFLEVGCAWGVTFVVKVVSPTRNRLILGVGRLKKSQVIELVKKDPGMSENIIIALITATGAMIGGIIGALINAYATIRAAGIKVEQTPSQALVQVKEEKVHWLWSIIGGAVIGVIVTLGILVFMKIIPGWPIPEPPIPIPLYDDFNNSAFDGKYNPDLWAYDETKHAEVKQENGVLVLKTTSILEDGENGLSANSKSWILQDLGSMEAKLKLDSSRRGQGSFVKIQVARLEGKQAYWIECQLDNNEIDHTSYFCNYEAGEWPTDNLIYEYQTEVIDGKYDTWYISRFEIDPKTLTIQFFLDDKLIGSYTPKDADIIRKKRFYPLIGSWTGAGDNFIGYIDDVRLGQ